MKKLIAVVIILTIFMMVSGCSKSGIQNLDQEELFSKEERYYVYFYRDDCSACEEVKPVILQYLEAIQEEKWQDKRRLYGFDISSDSGNESIYRVYLGVDGQGTDGKFYVNDVTSWNQLYIASTPSVISVTVVDGTTIVRYEAQGAEAVTSVLASHLGVDYTTPDA